VPVTVPANSFRRAADAIDQRSRIVGQAIAAPRHVLARSRHYKSRLIARGAIRPFKVENPVRHAAVTRRGLDRGDISAT
jgi:hypothetical protein